MTSLADFAGFANYAVGTTWVSGLLVAPGEIAYPRLYNGFAYKATQAAAARTGTVEPNWPVVAAQTVVDGGVTWECFTLSTITWQANNLYVTGGAEPAWPVVAGSSVVSGSVTLTCRAPVITDAKCPHGKVVLVASEKAFAGADDVVRYCATMNPLGWDPSVFPKDAGFLGTGEKMAGEPTITALAKYRGNMAAFGYSTVLVYQLDPDPARISLVDTIEGVGTPYSRAHASVMGDLYFTTNQGVRSLSLVAATGGVGATDVGTPVDELVVAQLAVAAANGWDPIGVHVPNLDEFWLVLGDKAYVLRQSKATGFAGWSEYTFPVVFTDATTLTGDLYLLGVNGVVYKVTKGVYTDNGVAITVTGETGFATLADDLDAMTTGLECIASSPFQVQVRYRASDPNQVTAAITMPAVSAPDGVIPLHLNAISAAALVFTHTADEPFTLARLAMNYEPLGSK